MLKASNMNLSHLSEEMHTLFDRAHSYVEDWSTAHIPLVNVIDGGGAIYIEAALPGLSPSDVSLKATGSSLSLSGGKNALPEEARASYIRREMQTTPFNRTITLPCTVDAEQSTAEFKNGLLTVMLPKKPEASETSFKIDIRTPE